MDRSRAVVPAGERRAKRRPAVERRAEILQAAIHAFAHKGYRETGTAEISRSVGVSEPTLYRYFASKRELYLEALEQSSREVLDHWRSIAAESASPVEALLALGRWYFDQLRHSPERLMLRARAEIETADLEVTARLRSHLLDTFALIHSIYRAAAARGLIDSRVDLEARTWLFIGLGALLDRTELLGARESLGEAEMAHIVAASAPELTRPIPDLEADPRARRA